MKKRIYLLLLLGFYSFFLLAQDESEENKIIGFYVCIPNKNDVPAIVSQTETQVFLSHPNAQVQAVFDKYVIKTFKKTYNSNDNEKFRTSYTFTCDKIQLMYDLEANFSSTFTNFQEYYDTIILGKFYEGKHKLQTTTKAPFLENSNLLFATPLPNDYGLAKPQKYLDLINAEQAWSFTTGDPNVLLGITDAGFHTENDLLHEEFEGSTTFPLTSTRSNYGHGTRVASIMAGNTNNGKGLASIGSDCFMIGSTQMNVTGMVNLWNSHPDIKVFNGSWGGCWFYQSQQDDVNLLNDNGVSLVFAAGNGNVSWNGSPTCRSSTAKVYPAAFDNVISVSSVNSSDHSNNVGKNVIDGHVHYPIKQDPKSGANENVSDVNHHNYEIDIVAPNYTLSFAHAWRPNAYYLSDGGGTSYGAPMVAGTIGLMLSVNYSLNPLERETLLKLSSKNIDYIINAHNPIHNDSLSDYAIINRPFKDMLGAGRLDAGKAVEMAYQMAQEYDTLEIYGRDFYRDWEFEIKNAPYAIEIENETFRDSIQVHFTARNFIDLKEGVYLAPDTGSILLEIDKNRPLALQEPPASVESASFAVSQSTVLEEKLLITPNPFVNELKVELLNLNYKGAVFQLKSNVGIVKLAQVLSSQTTNFDTSNLESGTYYGTLVQNNVVQAQTILVKNP